ncbi:MAG: c-type cytochrome [Anaerolineaceae bacterium]|nr:c-type cytochrome [Anaerolineaceae bacterium]
MATATEVQQERPKFYVRFVPSVRMEHLILLVTFTGLALTGLPQKYAAERWAQVMIEVLGGIESARVIHRFLATLLMAEAIFHGGMLTYKIFVLGIRASMIPGLRDVRDVLDWIAFNLGLQKKHPTLPRYNFGEKVEYLAVVWGTLIMVLTGFMMWNPIATANFLPGDTIPAARAAHGGEALLAVLSIITWHMYNVHFRRFNKSMFTGKISREAMEEEHGEELAAIERGEKPRELPAQVIAARKRRFWPAAVVITVLLVSGLFFFITFEQTAIQTVPRQQVAIFQPDLVPTEGDPIVGEALWGTLRCSFCHGTEAQGTSDGPAIMGTDVTLEEFFVQVRGGGKDMPAFGRGEIPDGYLVHLYSWLTQNSMGGS